MEKGGATVFPARGGYVQPKKGSAAFWYNLHASGEGINIIYFLLINHLYIYVGDYTTRHAGKCLLGLFSV